MFTNQAKITVSPNPASNNIIFSQKVQSVSIYDLNGRLIKSSIINGNSLSVSELSLGMYILQYETEKELFQTKLIKE